MRNEDKFWEIKTLAEMNATEWESLCDRCGLCCLIKAEDEDNGDIYNTNVICSQYDCDKKQCGCYQNRTQKKPDCISLTAELAQQIEWLPETCAYRLLAHGEPLPTWHPLITGDYADVPSVVDHYRHTGLIAWSPRIDLAAHVIGEKICTVTTNDKNN